MAEGDIKRCTRCQNDRERPERERRNSFWFAANWKCRHVVLGQLDHLLQRRRAVALDPLCHPSRKLGDELLQCHQIKDLHSAVGSLSQQPFLAGILELLGKSKRPCFPNLRDLKCWRLCSGVWPTRSMMTLYRSLYSRRLAAGSCWAASCASLESSSNRRSTHWSGGHFHTSAVFSKRSRKASGSSPGPILMRVTGNVGSGVAAAAPSQSIRLRNACQSSACAWSRSWNLFFNILF
ncbi:uncharacterized protein LOC127452547 [Myxocyprinus asiaticus]|uniref:uncharacterized protein LOC127452547 n=1 Tax=Myxocyprinus asiaticus TaxID=70543 RepID=UPI002223A9F3|nr:uncharacterized protein LOC127452547 [Myxocyprinus asiaticus]